MNFLLRWPRVAALVWLAPAFVVVSTVEAAEQEILAAGPDVYLYLNLARAGRLDHGLQLLKVDEGLVQTLIRNLRPGKEAEEVDPPTEAILQGQFVMDTASPTFANGLQETLKKFLETSEDYPGNYSSIRPWSTKEGHVVSRVFLAKASAVGCAIMRQSSRSVWTCILNQGPQLGEPVFSEEFFSSLKARSQAGITIDSMTAADLKGKEAPTEGGRERSAAAGLSLSAASLVVALAYSLSSAW